MQYDDRLATVLARAPERPSATAAQWRQLVDVLAQRRDGGDGTLTDAAYSRLKTLRAEVPEAVRRDAVAAIAHQPLAPALVALLADDTPAVATALVRRVRLPDADWRALLPRLGPVARGVLRHRRDLGAATVAALETFGPSDLLLSGTVAAEEPPAVGADAPEAAPAEPEDAVFEEWLEPVALIEVVEVVAETAVAVEPPVVAMAVEAGEAPAESPAAAPARVVPLFGVEGEEQQELPLAAEDGAGDAVGPFSPDAGRGQIRSIISRIARFRNGESPPPHAAGEPVAHFAFETDRAGVVAYADATPRGALIGETIARAAIGRHGVDGQAAGAFARRAPFRDARLAIAGEGAIAGDWRIAGVPVFAERDGRFLGYRCTARRPAADERAGAPAPHSADPGRGDTLRQVVHELRTPLNAIGGFAEMIRRQMRGPVATPYRERAGDIADQAGRLMTAVDDLDVAARLDGARLELQRLPVALAALVAPLCEEHDEAARRGAGVEATLPPDLPAVLGDAAAIGRMAARLLAAAAALAEPGERLRVVAHDAGEAVLLRIARPARLHGVAEERLFDPAWHAEGGEGEAPLLGLGFSLHLVRRLAAAGGGQLRLDDGWFTLRLPVAEPIPGRDAAGS